MTLPPLRIASLCDFQAWHPRALLLSAFAMLSCTSTQHITKVGEKTYRLSCKTSLAQCLEQVERTCTSGFEVHEATDERRTYGVTVGSAQTEVRSSEALVECRSTAIFGDDDDDKKVSYKKQEAAAASSAPRVCLPGSTQECIGGGGCRGGQACLLDGSAFGSCDCDGTTAASASATASQDAMAPTATPSASSTAVPSPSLAPSSVPSSSAPGSSAPSAPPAPLKAAP